MRRFGELGHRNTFQHLLLFAWHWLRLAGRAMLTEKRALLDHAHRCRRIAREIEHARATERLIAMAQEYEDRAATIGEEERKLQRA
jgi:hypothetical protein